MILIIDNYDSFTYNLYQYVAEISTQKIQVVRNDKITLDEIQENAPTHIILSPGPKKPVDAGICIELIQKLHKSIPIFGICLGHQSIAEAFGGVIEKTPNVMHGKTSLVEVTSYSPIYKSFPTHFTSTRYHSLIVNKDSLPEQLQIISETSDQTIMGIQHKNYPTFGCQYHPESILSEYGKDHFKNFLYL